MRDMDRSDEVLLASGVAVDFGEFYERHVRGLTAFVVPRVAGADAAFDVVAETFAAALEHREQYDGKRGPAIGWLIGIARHLIADARRRNRVAESSRRRLGMARIELDDEQLSSVEFAGQIDLAEALGELGTDERQAVLRRVLADQPYSLIAGQIGCSEQVARKRVSRGLIHLRNRLDGSER
jgi:RNA polymerase sigma-70 factor (ECF subfamily)